MAASKEIKSLLKSARSALDREDYLEAIKQCQAIFWHDDTHYLAHVLCGKAHLLLKEIGEARHQYRIAITSNEKEILAWKGLADLYDKYSPGNNDEKLEAIKTYSYILNTVTGDGEKEFNLYCKLAPLYVDVGQLENAAGAYLYLLVSASASGSITERSLLFLLRHPQYSQTQWQLIEGSYKSFLSSLAETKRIEIQTLFISSCMEWIKLVEDEEVIDSLLKTVQEECEMLESKESQETLLQLEIWKCLKVLSIQPLTEEDLIAITLLLDKRGEEEEEEREGVWLISHCLVLLQSRKIKEACTLASKGTVSLPDSCEGWFVSCVCHMKAHDYEVVINNARKGLEALGSLPYFIRRQVSHSFHILLIEAQLLEGNHKQEALTSCEKLYSESCDCHVIRLYVKALIANGMIHEAEGIINDKASLLNEEKGILNELKGHLFVARGDFDQAHDKFQLAINECPQFSEYHYWAGYTNWYNGNRTKSYPSLVKAGQLDSYNPAVFNMLGHYQRHVANDINRAVKCYKKAFTIHPGLTEAGISLGECLSALGEEESAYEVYLKITEKSPPTEAREAWLRIGLYHRRHSQYDEAIKCYLKVLHQNVSDSNVWECLGEAYLSRGSNIAAMKAFEKATELNPQSIFSQYQVAAIQQLIGLLSEAVASYTRVLELQDDYVPALKGRAESYYKLSLLAINNVLDSKAVSYVSLALIDLSKAVKLKPSFISLWKLIGDSCLSLYSIAETVARVSVPSELLGNDEGLEIIGKKALLELGLKSYKCSLHLCDGKSPYLLHNLALNYYHLAEVEDDKDVSKEYLEISLKLIKNAITLSPRGHTHWNALGVIAMHSILKDYALAQHSFISSLKIEPNNAVVWSNLGALYLINDNVKLAHLSFERSQSCDPMYSQGWIGDGLVAEIFGKSEETRNFLENVSELQYHDESALGYAYWVCKTLTEGAPSHSLKAHQSLVQARDGILKYVRRYPKDSLALNLLGLLYEHEGMMKQAKESISLSLSHMKEEGGSGYLPLVMHNHARLLSVTGSHSEALSCYESLVAMEAPDVRLGQALALFRARKFSEAAKMYQLLVDDCDPDSKSQLLLALSMCSFAVEDNESCKNLLFKVFQTPPPSLHGIVSLAAFAGYVSDPVLLKATLAELLKITESSIASLSESCLFALHSLSSMCDEDKEVLEVFDKIINANTSSVTVNQKPHMSLILRSLSDLSLDESLRAIQKVVHTHPGYLWAWPMIPYIMIVMGSVDKNPSLVGGYLKLAQSKAEEYCTEKSEKDKSAQSLIDWCKLLSNLIVGSK
ncbi:PREDICTED: tetratricopeptide repeat protein 37-like isoform X2 [Amphimedon queenslandica]|uniref:Tetratricopeptide repeat protein 37 n=1 Tax=Amphimedon queenslandica TaxID=400682 RepID=A0AAN0J6C1_AMPQE|nr:PREDICTED: tetratricopeptide repeat protein 37-like isoform X2 [Amphimedon queenslandica]|eukprot:XP_019852271.1 PREDICTED: tetratricopeptide repeat protein 37-like isoform X2 [Amphimedon queenslandica]